ncbi:carboxylesterase 5A-like isoform X1 [Arapaima gigas]
MRIALLSTGLLLLPCLVLVRTDGPVVTTKYGNLRGKYESVKGTQTVVHTYLSVPFARPPVGSLRLARPHPPVGWEGERDATQQPPLCLQDKNTLTMLLKNLSINMEIPGISENCLYLNIYTPAKPKANPELPVMVWIHGGGFVTAGASLFDGSALAAYENVVVVVIQYRLGILGFLSTGDEHAPGNLGLLDQVAALQWVQENIHSFGGNPKSVTIFGESAGGVSVSLQLLSPLSAGLFHRAIAESGTANMKVFFSFEPLPSAQAVANISGCDITSTKKIVECMMQKTEDEMLSIVEEPPGSILGLTVDGTFLTKSVDESFQTHQIHKVPFMTGVTNQEFGWLLLNNIGSKDWVKGVDREEVMTLLSFLNPQSADQWINDLIADEYLGTSGDRVAIRDACVEMMGDLLFVIPAIETANFHRDAGAEVYLYEFQHPPSLLQKKRPSFVKSDHGDEIFFVFGLGFLEGHMKFSERFTQEEEKLSRTVMAYFGNFARTGSPNGEALVPWQRYGKEAAYLEIGLEQRVGHRLKANRFTFLTKTLQEEVRARREQKHGEL